MSQSRQQELRPQNDREGEWSALLLFGDKLLNWFKLPRATSPYLNTRKLTKIVRISWIFSSF